MSKSLLDLSGKIDPLLIEIFDAIAGVVVARDIHYFVVGATARDMILSYGHDIEIKRATVDIDLGFEDAYRAAQVVRLRTEPVLDIPFATPAGLAVLKIVAWRERIPQGGKDADDLAYMMRTYLDAGNQNRLVKEHPDLLADDDFDYECVSA